MEHVTQPTECTCPLIEVSTLGPNGVEPAYVRGHPKGCPVHGREYDAVDKAAQEAARYGHAAEARYWSHVSSHHAAEVRRYADKAERLSNWGVRLAIAGLVVLAVVVLVQIAAAVMS